MISENSIRVRVFSFGRRKLMEKNFSVVVTSCQQKPVKKAIAQNLCLNNGRFQVEKCIVAPQKQSDLRKIQTSLSAFFSAQR